MADLDWDSLSDAPPAIPDQIASTATNYGVNPDDAVAIAKFESGMNPAAKNSSGASGVFQVMPSTWQDVAGQGADPTNPTDQIHTGIKNLANGKDELSQFLGRDPDRTELYSAHLFGAEGAKKFLSADDSTPIEDLFGKTVAKQNNLTGKTVGEVKDTLAGWVGGPKKASLNWDDFSETPPQKQEATDWNSLSDKSPTPSAPKWEDLSDSPPANFSDVRSQMDSHPDFSDVKSEMGVNSDKEPSLYDMNAIALKISSLGANQKTLDELANADTPLKYALVASKYGNAPDIPSDDDFAKQHQKDIADRDSNLKLLQSALSEQNQQQEALKETNTGGLDSAKYYAKKALGNVAPLAVGAGISALVPQSAPVVLPTVFGTQAYAQKYGEARGSGEDENTAAHLAAVSGAVNAGVAMIPGGAIASRVASPLAKAALVAGANEVAGTLGTPAEMLADKYLLGKDQGDIGSATLEAAKTNILPSLVFGAVGGMHGRVESAADRATRLTQELGGFPNEVTNNAQEVRGNQTEVSGQGPVAEGGGTEGRDDLQRNAQAGTEAGNEKGLEKPLFARDKPEEAQELSVSDLTPEEFSALKKAFGGQKPETFTDEQWQKAARLYAATAQQEGAARYNISAQKTLPDIAQDIDPAIKATNWYQPYDEQRKIGIEGTAFIHMPDDNIARLDLYPGDRIAIDASRLNPGSSMGSMLYHLAANYAHNNGLKFIGDPQGISLDAIYRRTENMLNSAARFGTTEHLQPHPHQLNPELPESEAAGHGVTPLRWETGNDAANMGSLLKTAYENVANNVPSVRDLRYNFDKGRFDDADGNTFTREDFQRLSANPESGAREARAGSSTLARTVFEQSALRRMVQGAGSEVRDGNVASDAQRSSALGLADTSEGSDLHKVWYAKEGLPDSGNRFQSPDEARQALADQFGLFGKRTVAKLEQQGLTFTHSDELPNITNGMAAAGDSSIHGVTMNGKAHVIWDQVPTERIGTTAVHEVLHNNLNETLARGLINKGVDNVTAGKQAASMIDRLTDKVLDLSQSHGNIGASVEHARAIAPEAQFRHEALAQTVGDLFNQTAGKRFLGAIKLGLNRMGVPLDWINGHEAALREIGVQNLRAVAEKKAEGVVPSVVKKQQSQESVAEKQQEPTIQDANGERIIKPRYRPVTDEQGNVSWKPTEGATEASNEPTVKVPSEASAGVKNTYKAQDRAERGLSEIEVQGRRDFPKVWDTATQRRAADSGYADRLAQEVVADPRPLRAEETAAMIQHAAQLKNEMRDATQEVLSARSTGNKSAETNALVRVKALEARLALHDEASRLSGYEQGLGLAMRNAMSKLDYSLDAQLNRFKAAGEKVSPEMQKQLEDHVAKIQELTDKIAELQANKGGSKRSSNPKQRYADLKQQVEQHLANLGKQPEAKPQMARSEAPQYAKADDLHGLMRQMATALVDGGNDSAHSILDQIHSDVGERAGLTRKQTANIISGVTRGVGPPLTALQAKVRDIHRQLRQEFGKEESRQDFLRHDIDRINKAIKAGMSGREHGPDTQEVTALKAERNKKAQQLREMTKLPGKTVVPKETLTRDQIRQNQLRKQMDDLQRRINTGDYSKVERKPIDYNKQTIDMVEKRDRMKYELEQMYQQHQRMNAGPVARTADFITNFHMASILSSLSVHPKLAAAVVGKLGTMPVQDLAMSAMRAVGGKGFRSFADKSLYGAGITKEGMAGIGKGLMEAPKGALEHLWKGASELDMKYGGDHSLTGEFTDYMGGLQRALQTGDFVEKVRGVLGTVGGTHAAVKEFLARPAFYHALGQQMAIAKRQMRAQGMSETDVAAKLQDPSTQALFGARAYTAALESKMQGKNIFADSVNRFVMTLEHNGGAAGKAGAFLFKNIFPIRKVPINIVNDVLSYAFGGLRAAGSAIAGFKGLNEAQYQAKADYILNNLGKQGVGAGLLAIGYLFPNLFGGVIEDKKKQLKAGEADIGGVHLGTAAFHGGPATVVQLGAGFRKVYESYHGKDPNALLAGLQSISDNLGALASHDIPYISTPMHWMNTAKYAPRSGRHPVGQVVGNELRSWLVPQVIQQQAKGKSPLQIPALADPYTGYRRPKNIVEDIELGIPGLRERVSP